MEVSEAASNVTYKIDDRTGPWIDVKRWMDEQVTLSLLLHFFFSQFSQFSQFCSITLYVPVYSKPLCNPLLTKLIVSPTFILFLISFLLFSYFLVKHELLSLLVWPSINILLHCI